ncbi:MAG: DUF433 domain-containing protein [Candidatus Roizmanbacteria bacterium]|nr:DUF433 domain-containing protein [Candidatus Roizmanbacteria bacterium]
MDSIVNAFIKGETAEEIAQQYPSLNLGDIYAVIGYYLRRKSEVEAYLQQRCQQMQNIKKNNEKRFDPQGIRIRLQARRGRNGGINIAALCC